MVQAFLVFVAASLFVNGVWLWQGRRTDGRPALAGKDIAVVNLFTALFGFAVAAVILVESGAPPEAAPAGYVSLFALTYLWVGANQFTGVDGAGLGWYSLLVAMIAIPAGLYTAVTAEAAFDYWMAVNWFSWAVLWAMFFVLLGLRKPIDRDTGVMAVVQAFGTSIVPAMLVFTGVISY